MPAVEEFDLVVVGAGISGLAAACFWQQLKGEQQRILLIDNHDDFGGHAKRNEFSTDDGMLLGYGGSESLQSPRPTSARWRWGCCASSASISIGWSRRLTPPSTDLNLSRGVYFDRKKNFGVDKVVSGDPGRTVADDIPRDRLNGRSYEAFIGDFPLPEASAGADRAAYGGERLSAGDDAGAEDRVARYPQLHPVPA